MKLSPPASQYTEGAAPSHSSWKTLPGYLKLWSAEEVVSLLKQGQYVTAEGKIAKKAMEEGLVDTCEGKGLWHVKKTTKALLALTRKPSKPKPAAKPASPPPAQRPAGPVWTDLENIGTYFGVGKNKVGTWLDQLGLRGYKPRQVNESGDLDMLDIANESKEKFRAKVPTELALERGFAQVETIDYKGKGGKDKSFEKYSWNLEMVKAVLVKNGHELDTERKLLLKGKGRNSDVKVESLDDRAKVLYGEWKKLHSNPKTRASSWDVFKKKPRPLLIRVEMLMGRPRYLQDEVYKREPF